MEFLELAKNRKSIRNYSQKEVSKESILELLEAARQAPSGGNRQPWHFYVVRDKNIKNKIYEKAYTAKWFQAAPVIIVVCADISLTESVYGERGKNLYSIQDTAAAIQNMLLCATDIGLSSCWCGAFNEEAIKEIFVLKEDMRPVALLPIGYDSNLIPTIKPNRRTIDEIATFID